MTDEPKRLRRSRKERIVAGFFGGLAEYFGLDPSLLRIAYVLATIFTLGIPGIVFYVMMIVIVPVEPKRRD